ncbi:tetratricopeptide repeat protein, partial [Candidatus Poribacteria bacterium]|nr:tetratricopeptide repeat protein [Candidatus Poribacteria bacterium]
TMFFFISIHANEDIQSLLETGERYIEQNDFEKAQEIMQRVVEIAPDNPEYINTLASIYIKLNNPKLAEEKYQEAIVKDPFFIKSYNNLGLSYIGQGKIIQAIEVFEQGLKKDRTYPKIYNNLALAYYDVKMIYKAIDTLERGMKSCTADTDMRLNLAALYQEMGWNNLALNEYRAAEENDPDNIKIMFGKSSFYMKQELFTEAIKILEQILSGHRMYAENQRVYHYLGYCYKRKGDFEKGEFFLKKNLKKFPGDIESLYELYSIYRDQNNISKAILIYKEIKKLNPEYLFYTNLLPLWKQIIEYSVFLHIDSKNIQYNRSLAECYYKLGLLDEVLKITSKIIKEDKDDFSILLIHGLTSYHRGNFHKSIETFKYIITKFNDKIEPHFYLYNLYRETGEFPDSEKEYEIAKKLNSGSKFSADYFILDKNLEAEREQLRVKIKKDDKNAELHYAFGKLFEKLGLNDYAILEYQDVILYEKDFLSAYSALIDLYLRTCQFDKAKKIADKLIEAAPDNKLSFSISDKVKIFLKTLSKSNDVEQELSEYQILVNDEVNFDTDKFIKLGKLYLKIGETGIAMQIVEKGLQKFQNNIKLLTVKGEIVYTEGNEKEAENIFDTIFGIDPRNPEVHYHLRNIYRDRDEIEKAIIEHKEVLRLNPEFQFPVSTKLRFKQMVGEYKILSNLYPEKADIYYELAVVYHSNRYLFQAEKNLKKCLSLNPNHKEAQEFLKYVAQIKIEENLSKGDILLGAKHILLKTLEDAEKVKKLLNTANNFDSLAYKWSQDQFTAKNGGDLGVFTRGKYLPEFEKAIEKLKEGEISNIIKTKLGYHIIMRTR